MANSIYNCSQQDLYAAAHLGWNNCLSQLSDFTKFKLKYDAKLITAKLAEIEAAQKLPDDQKRGSLSETNRIILTREANTCLENWQKLKRYIVDAYDAEMQKPKLEAAGQKYYEKASAFNWDSVQSLLTSGNEFIKENLTDLTADKNMPPTFKKTFLDDKTTFEQNHHLFLGSQGTASIGTDTKIKANNELHTKLMSMLLDGQAIYVNDETLRKQFVFDSILNIVSGVGVAGIKGTITNQTNGTPLSNVHIEILKTSKQATTDTDGKFQITQVAAAHYTIKISADGYQTKEIADYEVKVGTMGTLNIQLTPNP